MVLRTFACIELKRHASIGHRADCVLHRAHWVVHMKYVVLHRGRHLCYTKSIYGIVRFRNVLLLISDMDWTWVHDCSSHNQTRDVLRARKVSHSVIVL